MAIYMLSVHMEEGRELSEDDMQQAFKDVDALNRTMQDQNVWVFGGGLEPPDVSTVVREHSGEVLVTDGPFAETKEQLGGFWIIQAPDLDAALSWAKKATVACKGAVEVRPFQSDTEV